MLSQLVHIIDFSITYVCSTLGYTAIVFVVGTMSWWVPTAVQHSEAWRANKTSTDLLEKEKKSQYIRIHRKYAIYLEYPLSLEESLSLVDCWEWPLEVSQHRLSYFYSEDFGLVDEKWIWTLQSDKD